MKVIAELTVVPMGVGLSVSKYVAECVEIIEESGLGYELHGYGTNVEGEWDEVMAVIKSFHEKLHREGVPRVHTDIKLGTRTDKEQSIRDKIESVKSKLS
jgi:uncharacterized protein (TIGR00106 family)